jgi:hypothetical protein
MEKKNKGSRVNLKRGGGQLADKEGDGEQMCGMVTGTGVSERLPSAHPVTTSGHGTDRHADFVEEGSEQGTQSLVVFRLRWWKEGFMSIINRNFVRLLMRGVFSRVCSGVLWG